MIHVSSADCFVKPRANKSKEITLAPQFYEKLPEESVQQQSHSKLLICNEMKLARSGKQSGKYLYPLFSSVAAFVV